MRPSTHRFRRLGFAAALLSATAMSGVVAWQIVPAFAQTTTEHTTTGQTGTQQTGTEPTGTEPTGAEHTAPIDVGHPAATALPGFADLVQKVSPAVVTITSTMHEQASDESSPFPSGSPEAQQFGRFFGMPNQGGPQIVHALGSGFIVDSQGHVVTNDHVVKDATDIEVTLADGRKLPAKVVGVDPKTDLAVLQVKSATPLPHLALGNSAAARVGDWVVAVGNPFGLGGTVTAGILSARGRHIDDSPYDDFLQIDAPINRGNSGGPLFAQDGTVIGVNTAIYSPSGGSVGIGFAIPSNIVKQVVSQLETNGRVERGWLGVAAQQVSPTMAKALDLPGATGALVAEVQKDSPASAAGIEPGDVITKIGSETVKDPRALAQMVAALHSGSDQQMTVRRDGQDKTLTVAVAAQPDQDATVQSAAAEQGPKLGLALAPLNDEARQQLNLPPNQKGVIIAEVKQDSPAQAAGLQPGDVLEMVGNQAITSPQQAVTALRVGTQKSGAVALRVLRDGRQGFVALSAAPASEG
jgi:serine protease Do